MTKVADRKGQETDSDRFVVDGTYLRRQVNEAVTTFLAPLSGVYSAATGRFVERDNRGARQGETRKRA
jgi:hypothetical protein